MFKLDKHYSKCGFPGVAGMTNARIILNTFRF